MEIVRYDLTEDMETGRLDITPVPESMEGRFVSYEDYATLQERLQNLAADCLSSDLQADIMQEQVQKLAAENAAMKAGAEKAKEVVKLSIFEYWEDRGKLMDAILLITHSPATDAVIREIGNKAVKNSDDKKRMDWLCAHCVEVRSPQMYGSHAMFHAQQDSEEWDLPHHTTLREQVDAAISMGEQS